MGKMFKLAVAFRYKLWDVFGPNVFAKDIISQPKDKNTKPLFKLRIYALINRKAKENGKLCRQ